MEKKAFALRLDPAVYAAVEHLSAAELRSANAQIEILLREAVAARGVTLKATPLLPRSRPSGRKAGK